MAAAGADALVVAARSHLDAGRPVEALHLTDIVLTATPDHLVARTTAADAHRLLMQGSENFWETAWLRHSIQGLESS